MRRPPGRSPSARTLLVYRDGEQERSIRLEFQRCMPAALVTSKEEAVLEWF
jgi:hypothetical protein